MSSDERLATLEGVHRRQTILNVGGARLHGEWLHPASASPDAAPLVFLHEALGAATLWRRRGIDVPAWLAARTRRPAFVYDRLGHGASDPLPRDRGDRYLYEEAWDALPAVLDAAGIDSAILVGHSDGASIALLFAGRFPERCRAVIAEAPHVIVEEATLAGIRAAKEAYEAPDSRLRAGLARRHGDKAEALFRNWAEVWLRPSFQSLDLTPEMARLRAPTLLIQGQDDEYGTARQLESIAGRAAGPVETLLVPECGHAPHFDAAATVLPRVAAFVERL